MRQTKRYLSALFSVLLSLSMSVSSVAALEEENQEPQEISEQTSLNEAEEATGEETVPGAEETVEEPAVIEEEKETAEETPAEEVSEETPAAQEEGTLDEAETVKEEAPEEEKKAEEEKKFTAPEGFSVSEADREYKAAVKEAGMDSLSDLEEGKDYVPSVLLLMNEDRAYAETAAEIFHGRLVSFEDGLGMIELSDDVTVKEAFEASLSDESLPFVEPNYYGEIPVEEPQVFDESQAQGLPLPEMNDYQDWVLTVFDNPDPYLLKPLDGTFQWYHSMIHTYSAWNATMGKKAVRVAVMDQSVNENHEELAGKIEIQDVVETKVYGEYGHGTMMAGIIGAAVNNGKGGAGIAPNVSLIGINVFTSDTAPVDKMIQGVNKATALKVDILNMSLGLYRYDPLFHEAVKKAYKAGITMCAAAGNENTNAKQYPCGFPETIAVGSVTRNGSRSSFSNYGDFVTVSAPGSLVAAPQTTAKDPGNNSGYYVGGGTSQATAVTSAVLALAMSHFGHISPDESKALLTRTATPISEKGMGAGIINLEKIFDVFDKEAPQIQFFDKSGKAITDLKTALPEGSYAVIRNVSPGANDVILYTTDGTKPAVKDGEIINGIPYTPDSKLSLDDLEKGKTIKLTASVSNSVGVLGKASAVSFKTAVPSPAAVKIKTVALNSAKATIATVSPKGKLPFTIQLSAKTLKDTAGKDVKLSDVKHQWLSSNPKVATVDENGLVEAVGKGKATITLKLLDGSKKTAVCAVTVQQYVNSIAINGYSSLVPGTKGTYKASAAPANANTRTVTWSIPSPVAGITVAKTGIVTVAKTVKAGTSFTLRATANDGSGIYGERTIVISPKAKSIKIVTAKKDDRPVYDKKGIMTGVTLFTVDIQDGYEKQYIDNQIELASQCAENNSERLWTSSNPKVAVVDENGTVTGRTKGTAVITCAANDGSKKKASIKVTVRVPISSLLMDLERHDIITANGSITLNDYLSYGKEYGEPTIQKASWSLTKITAQNAEREEIDITPAVTQLKGVTFNTANGKITTNYRNLINAINNVRSQGYMVQFPVTVYAKASAADGTGYYYTPKITIKEPLDYLWYMNKDEGGELIPLLKTINLNVSKGSAYETNTIWVFADENLWLEVTTSDPSMLGANIDNDCKQAVYKDTAKGKTVNGYAYPVTLYSYAKRGKVSITVRPIDGTKEAATMIINIKE